MPYLEILCAAAINVAVGWVWYRPNIFGNRWMNAMDITKNSMKKRSVFTTISTAFLSYVVTGFVLLLLIRAMEPISVRDVFWTIFWLWLGFIACIRLSHAAFEQKPFALFWIATLRDLVSLIVMSIVFLYWPWY